jgi:hypothetical protein
MKFVSLIPVDLKAQNSWLDPISRWKYAYGIICAVFRRHKVSQVRAVPIAGWLKIHHGVYLRKGDMRTRFWGREMQTECRAVERGEVVNSKTFTDSNHRLSRKFIIQRIHLQLFPLISSIVDAMRSCAASWVWSVGLCAMLWRSRSVQPQNMWPANAPPRNN